MQVMQHRAGAVWFNQGSSTSTLDTQRAGI